MGVNARVSMVLFGGARWLAYWLPNENLQVVFSEN